ncbi:uncharacterized protein LOC111668460 isoform X1 [Seriola lalandi dorsalis]|uniref:uncharacterized protein LOC111668460 isoform X1 n=1 Tax=Seriola lalandi dorsalis TaxID=1841481 RepID=UPI000C6F63D4|nr:uncharacterized protein LOC111668460 isoform X1 [Seriola lalandi dorsalis]
MGRILLIYAVLLVCSCQIEGSSAVTPVFVQKGKDLLLEVMEPDVPENFRLLSWTFNGKDVLVRFLPGKEPIVSNVVYTGRVEASVKNFSVKLKNLQEADSGVYTARVFGDQEQILAGYNVTVQDPVSPVAMTVDSVSSSSDSCSLTVTCSTQYSHHINSTFTCDTNTCSQGGGERSKVISSGASLNVNLLNDLIICNHSNHISWTNDSKIIDHFCPRHTDPERTHVHSIWVLIIIAIAGGSAAAVCYRKIRKGKRENMENTVYAFPEVENGRPVNQSPTNDATTTYATVGSHTGPMGSTETRGNTLPESPYAEVGTTQPHEQSPSSDASGLPPNSTYALVGSPSGPMGSTETRGNTLPESLYAAVDKPSRA